MDQSRFDAFTRVVGRAPSRRALLPLLGSVLALPLVGLTPAGARKKAKKKKKKITLCLDGQTTQATRKQKKKLIGRGATPGACAASPPPTSPPPPSTCTPACEGKPCGADDGCGGTCGCAAGSVCHEGVCRACTVSCDGNGQTCGATLKAALAAGGTIYACPGRYVGNFDINAANLELVGAGKGDNPANNTVLDANGSGRVLQVKQGATATLRSLRITGGNLTSDNDAGGGIENRGRLSLTDCTVHKNTAKNGGGIFQVSTAELTLNACTISENTTTGYGGGLYANAGPVTIDGSTFTGNKGHFGGALVTLGSAMTIRGCTITANRAKIGAGLFNQKTVTFDSGTRVSANIASEGGGGIYQAFNTTTALNGARIISNVPDNCWSADGTPACGNG